MEWQSSNLKDNSQLLSKGQYDEIINYLKADNKFLWLGFNCLKARATSRRHCTFYH